MKHLYFKVNKEAIEVRCNIILTQKDILDILNKNIKIIEKRYKIAILTPVLEDFGQILYKGTPLPLEIEINPNFKRENFNLKDNSIELKLKSNLTKQKKELIRDLIYKTFAPKEFSSRVYYWQKITNLEASKFSFRKAKSRWGSCSYKNSISLNSRLLMLPQRLSDYVIVHELAHIVHKNHSKDFWALVEKFYPEYKEARKELKKYGALLT